jgi:hypothetical protein
MKAEGCRERNVLVAIQDRVVPRQPEGIARSEPRDILFGLVGVQVDRSPQGAFKQTVVANAVGTTEVLNHLRMQKPDLMIG